VPLPRPRHGLLPFRLELWLHYPAQYIVPGDEHEIGVTSLLTNQVRAIVLLKMSIDDTKHSFDLGRIPVDGAREILLRVELEAEGD